MPIAIKAYLERDGYPAEKALRLAISIGGDSDTIGAMTASIAGTKRFTLNGGGFSEELEEQCRALLPADLLDINDRFEAFVSRPLNQSYYVDGKLFASEYLGDKNSELPETKLKSFRDMRKASHCKSPETQEQTDFVSRFVENCRQKEEYLKMRTHDRIRGSLMAGAAGDALGYTVEFMSRSSILAKYGEKGITKFDLTAEGKALVSDDTQMTLFTANGMLMGVTRGYMRGIGGLPEYYVDKAYID